LQNPAPLRERLLMPFLMHDAGRGGHPLHVARADPAVVACRVTVLQFALIDNGHGLENTVRMFAHATGVVRGRALSRTGVVEEQERADLLALALRREEGPNGEPVADPVRGGAGLDADEFLHVASHGKSLRSMDQCAGGPILTRVPIEDGLTSLRK